MLSWGRAKKFPLHTAVINLNLEAVKELSKDETLLQQKNDRGFTPLELAKLLNLKDVLKIFGLDCHRSFNVMHEGDVVPAVYSVELLEKVFGIRYLPHLRFNNIASLIDVIDNCPWILRSCIGKENRDLAEKYKMELTHGYVASVLIKWIDEIIGYGLFANEDLPAGAYVGEYTGLVRRLYRYMPDQNPYCFQYPTKFWSWDPYAIDAMWQGNETRFINHSSQPNLEPVCLMENRLLHTAFLTNKAISAGTELTFNYGPDFWKSRK